MVQIWDADELGADVQLGEVTAASVSCFLAVIIALFRTFSIP